MLNLSVDVVANIQHFFLPQILKQVQDDDKLGLFCLQTNHDPTSLVTT